MKYFGWKISFFVASLFAMTAMAANFDGSKPLLCSLGQVIECDVGSKCRSVSNESVDAPDFVKVDVRKKELLATTAGVDSPPDKIDNVQKLDNRLILQGTQGGTEGVRDALGWSMSISHETGQMVLTGAGENAGFVVFGACTPN